MVTVTLYPGPYTPSQKASYKGVFGEISHVDIAVLKEESFL